MIKNYKITVCYDGTEYHGWQIQPQKKTIQGEIEKALYHFKSQRIPVTGAGRTDAGVHAAAQVAHFKADLRLSTHELLNAFNGNLPPDIRITKVETVDMAFHARKSARSKTYQYRIFNAPNITPFQLRYVLFHPKSLDIQKMKQAASFFVREDDFTAISSNRLRHPIKKVIRSEIKKKENEIIYTVEADGFLKYMVRTMVGALLMAGRGKITPETIESLFKEKKRSSLIPTAPPQGLCLLRVLH
jgi:tRNA pseudouridine38-40 synthase